MKVKDLVGQKFGRLKVIRREGSTKEGRAQWLCKCECGREIVVGGTLLRRGFTKSCGCYRSELMKVKRSKYVAYKGEWITQSQLAEKLGLAASTITQRRQLSGKREDWYRKKKETRRWRGRAVVCVVYNGQKMTLKELSQVTGIPDSTLRYRYRTGVRGRMLIRETGTSKARKEKHAVEETIEIREYQRR